MTGDRLIRITTAAVVAAVAAFAAVVSYSHIYDLGRVHGQSGTAARLLPLSVDGLILAASLVLLHEARNGRPVPRLARAMLGLGVAATVAANVAYGSGYGVLGAVISAWPAVAFIGAAELLMLLIRSGAVPAVSVDVPGPDTDWSGLNGHRQAAAELFAADIAAGQVPGIRAIRSGLHVGQPKAEQVQAWLRTLTSDRK